MSYIQQVFKAKVEKWKYLVFALIFAFFVVLNMFASQFVDVNEVIKKSIEEKGKNGFLLESMSVFMFFLLFLLLWVKFTHKQTITSLTTSRKKVDWKRIWFSFVLWGGITAVFIWIDVLQNADNYIFNFN